MLERTIKRLRRSDKPWDRATPTATTPNGRTARRIEAEDQPRRILLKSWVLACDEGQGINVQNTLTFRRECTGNVLLVCQGVVPVTVEAERYLPSSVFNTTYL